MKKEKKKEPNVKVVPEKLMQDVSSSNIAKIGYVQENRELFVSFHNGKTYAYTPITLEGFLALLNADSVGKYFNENIKDNSTITWERVE